MLVAVAMAATVNKVDMAAKEAKVEVPVPLPKDVAMANKAMVVVAMVDQASTAPVATGEGPPMLPTPTALATTALTGTRSPLGAAASREDPLLLLILT